MFRFSRQLQMVLQHPPGREAAADRLGDALSRCAAGWLAHPMKPAGAGGLGGRCMLQRRAGKTQTRLRPPTSIICCPRSTATGVGRLSFRPQTRPGR